MIDFRNKLILASGRFSGTGRSDLKSAFDTFLASPQCSTLVLHFHGGLVTQANAEKMATRLLPVYTSAGAYPLFTIWQSGFLETLQNNWCEIASEDVFEPLKKRVLQFVIGKLDQVPGQKGQAVELPTVFEVEDEIQQNRTVGTVPYADRDSEAVRIDPQLTAIEEAQFKKLLEGDSALATGSVKLLRADAPELRPELELELDQARAAAKPGERGLFSLATFIAAGLRILARSLERFASGRHHGIYTTVIEEVARELKGDRLGGIVWKHMKKDTADAFSGPADTCGGSALIEELNRIWKEGAKPRIVLVGHSAGAVYIANFLLQAVARMPTEMRFEVVFLAPACTFKLLDEALSAVSERIKSFRSFGMEDQLERMDAILPPLYNSSLLYLVAALLEDAVDMPLVGMQRYHSREKPYDAQAFPEIYRVLTRAKSLPQAWIWADTVDSAGPGLKTLSHKHGDFDNEEATIASVAHLVAHGVV